MKKILPILVLAFCCASAYAQPLSENCFTENGCRIDSAVMNNYRFDVLGGQLKRYFTFDSQNRCILQENIWLMDDYTEKSRIRYEYNGDEIVIMQSFNENYEDGNWNLISRNDQISDADGNLLSNMDYEVDSETGEPVLISRQDYTYDSKGNVIQIMESGMNYDSGVEGPISRTTYTYDEQGNNTEYLIEIYKGTEYVPYVRTVSEYGPYGRTGYVYYSDNHGTGELRPSTKSVTTYDEAGNMIKSLVSYYGTTTDEWYNYYYNTMTYDEAGNMVSYDNYEYYGEKMSFSYWSGHAEYVYDAKGRIVEQKDFDMLWTGVGYEYVIGDVCNRTVTEYNDHGDLVSERMYSTEYDPETWEPLPGLYLHEEMIYYVLCNEAHVTPISVNGKSGARKIIEGGRLIIEKDGHSYDLTGRQLD